MDKDFCLKKKISTTEKLIHSSTNFVNFVTLISIGLKCLLNLHEWGNSPMIFTSDAVTGESHWQIVSRVTNKWLFTTSHTVWYFLHDAPTQTKENKTLVAYFVIVATDGIFELRLGSRSLVGKYRELTECTPGRWEGAKIERQISMGFDNSDLIFASVVFVAWLNS